MSHENVELVRAICSPWENGDFTSFEWAHPDIEFVWADGPTPGARTGVAAMKDSWREALSAFEQFDVEVDRYVALDGERVLVLMHNSGRGKASGFELGRLHSEARTSSSSATARSPSSSSTTTAPSHSKPSGSRSRA